jgi:hypothetical protein
MTSQVIAAVQGGRHSASMRHIATAALLFAGLIHLLPLAGIVGPERLSALYGISVSEPNLEILLRHRAVLFGLLGGFFVYAAFHRELQAAALLVGLVSAGAFVAMALMVGGYNPQIGKVVVVDVLCLAALSAGAAASWWTRDLPRGAAW